MLVAGIAICTWLMEDETVPPWPEVVFSPSQTFMKTSLMLTVIVLSNPELFSLKG